MNFRRGTADGLSLLFIVVWMVGDITNLAGESHVFSGTLLP